MAAESTFTGDRAALQGQIARVLGCLRPTRSQADRRARALLTDAWTHLQRGGDPQALVDGLSTAQGEADRAAD